MALKISTITPEKSERKPNPFAEDVTAFAKHVAEAEVPKGQRIIATVDVPADLKDSTAKVRLQDAARKLGLSARTVPSEPGTISFWLSTRKGKDESETPDVEADDNA